MYFQVFQKLPIVSCVVPAYLGRRVSLVNQLTWNWFDLKIIRELQSVVKWNNFEASFSILTGCCWKL